MDRILYKGGIASINTEKRYGYIESIEHPETLWFSLKYLRDPVETGDTVMFEITLNRRGEKEASRIRKTIKSANGAMAVFGLNTQVNPEVKEIVQEQLRKMNIDITKDYQVIEFDNTGKNGKVLCVGVDDTDKVLYARPWKAKRFWKFVLEREPDYSSMMTIRLKKDQGIFIILSAHFGPTTPAFPWDPNGNTDESRSFWKDHALVLDGSIKLEPDSIHGFPPEEVRSSFERDE